MSFYSWKTSPSFILASLSLSAFLLLSFFFLPGCLGKVDPWDQFNSSITMYPGQFIGKQILFMADSPQGVIDGLASRGINLKDSAADLQKLTDLVAPIDPKNPPLVPSTSIDILDTRDNPYTIEKRANQLAVWVPSDCRPVGANTPCQCMVCTNDRSLWERIPLIGPLIKSLIDKKVIEASLAGSDCQFLACNRDMFSQYLGSDKPDVCTITEAGKDQPFACIPRFFMIGGGPNPGEFSLAQNYCAGRLTMPVLWATPKADAPPSLPGQSLMTCYLEKGQMPVVVWYSEGQFMDKSYFETLASRYALPDAPSSGQPYVDGPVILTTEALLDPRINPSDPNSKLSTAKLDQVADEVRAIKEKCPKCMAALALKPLFSPIDPNDPASSKLTPNLCPLDYLLAPNKDAPIMDCAKQFDMSEAQYVAARGKLARSVPNSNGNTLAGGHPLVDLIGVGFIANEDDSIPACSAEAEVGKYMSYSRAVLQAYYKPSVWYAVGISPGATNTPGCAFSPTDVGNAYDTMMGEIAGFVSSGVIGVAPYRFLDSSQGLPMACDVKSLAFVSSLDAAQWAQFSKLSSISSDDGAQTLDILKIYESAPGRVTFSAKNAAGDEMAYIAKGENGKVAVYLSGCQFGFASPSGDLHPFSSYTWFSNCQYYFTNQAPKGGNLYSPGTDVPTVISSTQQPVVFSTNGKGGVCIVADANKMIQRTFALRDAAASTPPITPPADPALRKNAAALRCGGCLASTPMPKAFCAYSNAYHFNPGACDIYPQMDAAFYSQNVDPVFMRSIAVVESNLGHVTNGVVIESGPSAPACAVSVPEGSASACARGDKSPSALIDSPSLYCTANDISSVLASKGIPPNIACGLGVFQCLDGLKSDYNPFNPYDSATCGVREFLGSSSGNRYTGMLDFVNTLREQNQYAKAEIGDGEVEWYAAFFAAYGYRGMALPRDSLMQYVPRDANDNLVKYLVDKFTELKTSNPSAYPEPAYGIKWIVTYNDGINVCGGGCLYQTCQEV